MSPFLTKFGPNTSLRQAFSDAEQAWVKKNPEHYIPCYSYIYKILASMIRYENYYCNTENYSKISDAVVYLHAHYLEPDFRIEHLLSRVNMSSRYFEMLFAAYFKMTPKEYVVYLKLELAKELLQSEKNTVTSIASQLGFSDVYHFSRTFKSKIGLTPTQYKESTYKK